MTRAIIITNPAAARTRPGVVNDVIRTLIAGGWDAEAVATCGPGDARRIAEAATAESVDVVAVFGGDGTTMQAAAALVGTDVALGLIPGGTGNLLAGNLRIPAAPVRAAQALLRSSPKRIDLGRMERPDGTHYFAVACGAGIDARVMVETRSEQKRRWGMMAYVSTTLRLIPEMRSVDYLVTVDGREYDAHAAMVLVANCGEVIPPFIRLGPGIRPDDGLLDVVAVQANSLGQGVQAVWHLLRSGGSGISERLVGFARGREVRVEGFPPQPAQLDGEPGGETPFTASIVPGALSVMMPGTP